MKLNNKGFSYKEFFAVIVIVAILIMAIVPAMLTFMQHSKDSAVTDSVIVFRKQVDREILSYINGGNDIADGCYFVTNHGDICLGKYKNDKCDSELLKIDIDGLKPNGGYVDIEASKISVIHNVFIDNKYVNEKDDEYYITQEPIEAIVCVSGN